MTFVITEVFCTQEPVQSRVLLQVQIAKPAIVSLRYFVTCQHSIGPVVIGKQDWHPHRKNKCQKQLFDPML